MIGLVYDINLPKKIFRKHESIKRYEVLSSRIEMCCDYFGPGENSKLDESDQ
jgi:hypothetical protein